MKLMTLIPKSEARKIAVQRRSELGDMEIRKKTDKLVERLIAADEYVYANTIHCYVSSRPSEVDTRKLIDIMEGSGKAIVVPKLNKAAKRFKRFHFMGWDSMIKNGDGYLEPKAGTDEDLSDIDLIIVPALAVSIKGQRVGYGGRYYDKLLKDTHAPKIALAFEYQVFDNIETETHDVRIDKIITERRTINTRDGFSRS